MKRPLVPFAKNVGSELLRGPIIVGEKVVLIPPRVARENIRHALDVSAREVPRKIVPWRADAELTLGKIDRLDSRFQGKTERAKTMPGIDAVAIEFAWPAGRDNNGVAEKRDEPIRVLTRAPLRRHCQRADHAALLTGEQ